MNDAHGHKRLVITDRNQVAAKAVASLASGDGSPFSTLLIHGGGGTGKTLMLRTAEAMHKRLHPNAARMFLNAGELIRWPESLDDAVLMGIDLLLVDDIDLICKHERAQHALLDVMATVERIAHGSIIITSTHALREIPLIGGVVPRLMSRLYASAACELQRPDIGMREGMIRAELENWANVTIEGPLIASLAHCLPPNGHVIAGAVRCIALAQQMSGVEQTHEEVFQIINASFGETKRISVASIQQHVSDHFHIPAREMVSQRRAREVARPRQVSMFLSKVLTPKSLPDIGRLHGGRDHTTVIHALRQITRLRTEDPELDNSIRILERELTH